MTIQETIHKMLCNHGIWDNEAAAIIEQAKADKTLEAMQNRWNDDAKGYPKSVLVITWIAVKRIAVEWLQEHKPKHFALFMLQDETV